VKRPLACRILLLLPLALGCRPTAPAAPTSGALPGPALDPVAAARPQLIAAAPSHIEGPSWLAGDLFFAQDGQGLMRLGSDGRLSRYHPEVRPIGTFALADGSLLICDKRHILLRMFQGGRLAVLPGGGARLCNDLTVDAAGNIYFTDFDSGIFRVTPGGDARRILAGLSKPNGIEVDPSGRLLYFMSGDGIFRTALPPGDADLGAPERVATTSSGGDGCAFDEHGKLWVAAYRAGKIDIFDPGQGRIVASIDAGGTRATNLTFGGPARDVLFVTVGELGVFRTPVRVRGFPGHPGATAYASLRELELTPIDAPVPEAGHPTR
jgi:sugar lactone lactonase YvrE